MKRYRVRLTEDAEQDLIDIYRYIALHDSVSLKLSLENPIL